MKKIIFSFLCLFSINLVSASGIKMVQTVGDQLRVREKPTTKSKVMELLYTGNWVELKGKIYGKKIGRSKVWYKIKTPFGRTGFIHSKFIATKKNKRIRSLTLRKHRSYLVKLFGKRNYSRLTTNKKLEKSVTNLKSFYIYFEHLKQLKTKLAEGISEKYRQLQDKTGSCCTFNVNVLSVHFPIFQITYAGEGTVALFAINLNLLKKVAQKIKSKIANQLLETLIISYGTQYYSGQWPTWFIPTWDYGGYSLLGNNIYFKILKKIEKNLKYSIVFKKTYDKIIIHMIASLATPLNIGSSYKQAVQEFNKILKLNLFSIEQKKKLIKGYKKLKLKKKVYFNCKKMNSQCQYG